MKKCEKRFVLCAIHLAFVGVLAGCAGGPKQLIGTLGGGAVGAGLGSQIGKGSGRVVATALGTLLGSVLGAKIGADLDDYDKQLAAEKTCEALESAPSGRSVAWRNPDTGNHGNIIPQQASYDAEGRVCRRFTQEAWIDGRKVIIHGTAYRTADGWQMVQ